MVETGYFKSGDSKLFYSCAVPDGKVKDVGIMFVHAGGGTSLGPHRMFVEMANNFNLMGYPTFRFDLRGCGDSGGSISQGGIEAEVFDVVEAARFFISAAKVGTVILLGISRGARICFSAMTEHSLPLRAMILLSTPISGTGAALKSFGSRLTEYIFKLKDPKYLCKLLSGRVNISQIWKTLTTSLQLGYRYKRIVRRTFESTCPVLFIYGERDPTSVESCRYYTDKCHEKNLACDFRFIVGANHSFFHYKWKEEALKISEQWLEKIIDQVLR